MNREEIIKGKKSGKKKKWVTKEEEFYPRLSNSIFFTKQINDFFKQDGKNSINNTPEKLCGFLPPHLHTFIRIRHNIDIFHKNRIIQFVGLKIFFGFK